MLAREADLEALPADEYYWHQLVGCRVEEQVAEQDQEREEGHEEEGSEVRGRAIGNVVEIWETGAHDVLVVRDDKGRQHLIPTAREFMQQVDLEERRIVVRLLPGLLELSEDED